MTQEELEEEIYEFLKKQQGMVLLGEVINELHKKLDEMEGLSIDAALSSLRDQGKIILNEKVSAKAI